MDRAMASKPPEAEAETESDKTKWSRPAVLRRLRKHLDRGAELTDPQANMLVDCVRNPDAPQSAIIERNDVGNTSTLKYAIRKIQTGGYTDDVGDFDPRLNDGPPGWTDEPVKKRAVIDFLARHPDAFDKLTYEEIADSIERETGVRVSPTYPRVAINQNPGAVEKRRRYIRDEVEEDGLDESERKFGEAERKTLRTWLEEAGIEMLPDENLDDVITLDQRKAEVADRAGEAATRSVTERDDDSTAASEADDSTTSAESEPDDSVEIQRDGARYEGPQTGLDLTSGRGTKLLHADAEQADSAIAERIATIRDEAGVYGEDAYKRDVSLDDKGDLESELRRLRTIVSTQGALIRELREALDGLEVSVEVTTNDTDE